MSSTVDTSAEPPRREVTPPPAVDEPLVRAHVEMLHKLAAPLAGKGKLVVARFRADRPKQKAVIRHFEVGQLDEMTTGIVALAGEKETNTYAGLYLVRPDLPDRKKGAEADVVAVLGLVADFDDADADRWAERLPRPPDYVLETSPGRFQAAYLFDQPASVADTKPIALALQAHAGCDHGTADVSHVWRVPGTPNWPTKPKLAAGRPPAPQSVRVTKRWTGARTTPVIPSKGNGAVHDDEDEEEGVRAASARAESSNGHRDDGDAETAHFVSSLPQKLRLLIEQPTPDGRRSHAINAVILTLLDRGLAPERIEALIRSYPEGIGAKYVGRSDLNKEVGRIHAYWLERRRRLDLKPLERMNADHALILIGNGASILFDTLDTEGQPEDRFLGLDAFRTWYGNSFVEVGDPPKRKPIADWWLKHPDRRSYKGLVFAPLRDVPDHYNLWKGFAVQPSKKGDWSLFREHLLTNVCQGDDGLFRWVFAWFAQIVQRPEERPGTSLAIRGKQGTGKTKVGEVFGSLLPRHYLLADTSEQVIGKFNSHMASLLLLHADEAFFAGDPRSAGRLKSLITAHTNSIERKGQDIFQVRNHIRLLITSNERWLVPAALDERRFAVLDIGERNAKDANFFRRLDAQLDDGGRERLLYDLQNFDLSTVDLRKIPDTQALQDQKLQSLEPEAAWWLDTLRAGALSPRDDEWPKEIACETVHDLYAHHASRTGVRRRSSETMFGAAFRRLVPGLKRRRGTVTVYDDSGYGRAARRYVYALPPLDECRRSFEQTVGRAIEWDDDEEGGAP